MASSFHSLYLPSADRSIIIQALQEALTVWGYTAFDPFALIPGKSYTQAVRLFVAPWSAGWLRVIGEPDTALLPALSQHALCLSIHLDQAAAAVALYTASAHITELDDLIALLKPYFRVGTTPDTLRNVLAGTGESPVHVSHDAHLPVAALSDDLQSLAKQVDMKQANSMFARLSNQLMKKAGGDQEAAALLKSGADWDSAAGKRIRALMACLTVPEDWRTPDFPTLRDAYQLHLRRQRLPNARLYPGDAETMAQVPNALEYTPIYAGK
jgi:hypothetical protein